MARKKTEAAARTAFRKTSVKPAQEPAAVDRTRKWTDWSLDELREEYASVAGRPIQSEDRRYIINKIVMARRGALPDPKRKLVDPKLIPLRFNGSAIEALDAWLEETGEQRNTFVVRAIQTLLRREGKPEIAALF